MGDADDIQKPSTVILYRQSSLETRLSPVHLSDESNSETEDEVQEKRAPTIVDCKTKETTTNSGKNKSNLKFKAELELAIATRPLGNLLNKTHVDEPATKQTESKNEQKTVSLLGLEEELKQKMENEFKKSRAGSINDDKNNIFQNALSNIEDSPKQNFLLPMHSKPKPAILPKPTKENSSEKIATTDHDDVSLVGTMKALALPKKDDGREVVGGSRPDEMATARPKSPRPAPNIAIRGEKDESIWDKLGTLGRKKRIKEVQEVQEEGKYAIDSPGCPAQPIIPPEEYNLEDNEERCMIDKRAYKDPKFLELLNVLKEWINDELASQRIIVQDVSEDLYDGQVLQKLLEKLTGDKLDVPEVTQSEEGQKQKLSVVLSHFNQVLGIHRITHNKWSVEAIHSKNIVAITHLLVALARHFRPPVRLPEHVSVDVVVVQKVKGVLNHETVRETLTRSYEDVGMRCERDAFDTLFDHAPDKLQVVKKSLVTFVNKHLNKMNFEVTEIESQFHDGVYLIMLMGLLEGFFVPHYSFHLTPHEFDQKVHNVTFAFQLMEEVGLQKPKARPEDVVNMDLKSTLRVLYNLFLRYKTII